MKKIHFKTRSRVIRTLGDRLVSDENAAIIELVKNITKNKNLIILFCFL